MPSRGAWSNASRSLGASVGAALPGRHTKRSAITGAGSDGSSRSGRCARATRSSASSSAPPPRRPRAAELHPNDPELIRLREWLSTFLVFVRLFDRAVGLVPRFEPRELERALRLLGEVPDDAILRLIKLLEGLNDDDVLELVGALSRLSPTAARRATKLMSGVVRTVIR